MAKYRGSRGSLSQGGVIVGSAFTKGTRAQGQTSHTFDGNGATLNGVVRPGDRFTVAGDAQQYTVVTGGVIGAGVANEVVVTFTPAIVPGGGWADNAAVTFVSNSMSQIRAFEVELERPYIEGTVMGDNGQTGTLDIPRARGRITALLDYADLKQKALIDQVKSGTDEVALALTLVISSGKHIWLDAFCPRARVNAQIGQLIPVEFDFQSEGGLSTSFNWN